LNIGAYELLYEDGQLPILGGEFLNYDTSDINQSEFRELLAFERFCQSDMWSHHDLSGIFSPRFFDKTGISGEMLINFIDVNPNYDVYLFHPYPLELLVQNNFLDLAELEHPGIQKVLHVVWEKIFGEELPQIRLPHDRMVCCHCNYVIASPHFWSLYAKFVQSFMALLDSDVGNLLRETTPYTLTKTKDASLPMVVFVFERVLSHFIKRFIPVDRVINFAYAQSNWRPIELFPNENYFVRELLNVCKQKSLKHGASMEVAQFMTATHAYFYYRKLWSSM